MNKIFIIIAAMAMGLAACTNLDKSDEVRIEQGLIISETALAGGMLRYIGGDIKKAFRAKMVATTIQDLVSGEDVVNVQGLNDLVIQAIEQQEELNPFEEQTLLNLLTLANMELKGYLPEDGVLPDRAKEVVKRYSQAVILAADTVIEG